MRTLVVQSHRQPLPHAWLDVCMESVREWAAMNNFEYQWLGDELFDYLPDEIRQKTRSQPVVASDLARILLMQDRLRTNYKTVVWCDADFLIFSPDKFNLPDHSFALGREVWVQHKNTGAGQTPGARVKVHNAFMTCRRDSSFLNYYADAATQLIEQHPGPFVSQFIGPKLLTAWHNLVAFPVVEEAAVLSPLVAKDLLYHGHHALDVLIARSSCAPLAFNMCASSVVNGDLSDAEMMSCCAMLKDAATIPQPDRS